MNKSKEPLFHIVKRGEMPWYFGWCVRAVSIVLALICCSVITMLVTSEDPIQIFATVIDGSFGSSRKLMVLLQNTAMLLCVALALTPAFKMRFWNIGGEGQALVGALAAAACMILMKDQSNWVVIPCMVLTSILAGALWGAIPAFFKAKFGTNETLFTLMMNYVATQLVAWFLKEYVKSGSGVMDKMPQYGLPVIGEYKYLLNVILVAVLTLLVYVYLKHSKQGYEITVVGESENTARYIGINVKKVVIRTMLISGALCGVAGLLLVGGTNHTISTTTIEGRGFTAIMVSWLAKFNPLFMVLTTFLVVFLEQGSKQLTSDFGVSSSIADISTGIILLFIIGCEFFLQYRIVGNKNRKEAAK